MHKKNNIAFVFPGQGSQSVGMLADCIEHPIVVATLKEADDALEYKLSDIIKLGDEDQLGQTEVTQPALLAVSIALWRMWCAETNIRPILMAGHSLGEYSALVAAGVIDFKEGIKLVSLRGKFMQEAVPPGIGAMAAIIGMSDIDVISVCESISEKGEVAAVNFNSPGQVVIAGEKAFVDAACALAKERGARRAMPLPVSVPSHCVLMKPASDRLADMLGRLSLNPPEIDIIHNVDVSKHEEEEGIKESLITQLYQPVRWTETIQTFVKEGIDTVVECGSGKILTGLIRRIDKNLSLYNILNKASLDDVIKTIN